MKEGNWQSFIHMKYVNVFRYDIHITLGVTSNIHNNGQ